MLIALLLHLDIHSSIPILKMSLSLAIFLFVGFDTTVEIISLFIKLHLHQISGKGLEASYRQLYIQALDNHCILESQQSRILMKI